jgi:hypothetical protein
MSLQTERTATLAPIFDGRTLEGWGVYGGSLDPSLEGWRVSDGAIMTDGRTSHLYYAKQQFADFEFQADVKITAGGNSGIYFRAAMGPGFPAGYEAQVNNTDHGTPNLTGSLYGFQSVTQQLVADDTWFRMRIRAESNLITIAVNRQEVVRYIDPARTYMNGYFALQQLYAGTVVQFRNLLAGRLV